MPVARYHVDGPSMEPAYRHGDRLLVDRVSYRFREPAAGDVVVLRDPDDAGRYLLKRIFEPADGADGAGGYYVLGDNADQSRDSRQFGPVARSLIIGRAWRKY